MRTKWARQRLAGLENRCEVKAYIPPGHIIDIAEERTQGIVRYFEEVTRNDWDYMRRLACIETLARSCYMQGVNDTVFAAVTQLNVSEREP